MPLDLLRQLLQERIDGQDRDVLGEIVSRPKLLEMGTTTVLAPVADVKLQDQQIILSVPIAANNQELRHALPGTPVLLRRSNTGRVEIIGLSKRAFGNTHTYTITLPITLPATSGGTSGITSSILVSVAVSGFTVRVVTLGELETVSGFGVTPLEALALFNAAGTFVRLT